MTNFPFTKSEVINNLTNFSQNELYNYTTDRNFDYGSPHNNVSFLYYLKYNEQDSTSLLYKVYIANSLSFLCSRKNLFCYFYRLCIFSLGKTINNIFQIE